MNKPFLRWAGGKAKQLDQILPHLPAGKRLVEPFVGAGSVFMNAGFDKVLVGDVNKHLIVLYRELSKPGADVARIKELHDYVDSEARYLELREKFNSRAFSPESMAAFFLVLNTTCFNGLSRFNRKGDFNVPWCKNPNRAFPLKEVETFWNFAQSIQLDCICGDFSRVFQLVSAGDVVFCDPPYQPMPDKYGFTNYSGNTFTMDHQKKLVDCCLQARKRNVPVVITNSSAPAIVKLYTDNEFEIHPLIAPRNISAKASTRGNVNDIIAVLK